MTPTFQSLLDLPNEYIVNSYMRLYNENKALLARGANTAHLCDMARILWDCANEAERKMILDACKREDNDGK